MIRVQDARTALLERVRPLPSEQVPIALAVGRFLAADAVADDAFPRFDMSAVDGYAVGDGPGPWRRIGAVAAGEVLQAPLGAEECARIFTGAQVPDGTAAVLMQEHCREEAALVHCTGAAHRPGANIRRCAEGYRPGDVLVRQGERLDPAAIGLLASSGIGTVLVARLPRVALVRTGGEFIAEGGPTAGRIHGSNEVMLQAAVQAAGAVTTGPPITIHDQEGPMTEALARACVEADLVLTTGGVSVGDHDLVRPVLERLGATVHFHGVRQKPGKPMLFATIDALPVIGLPGNPRAVLVLFDVYVRSIIRALQGACDPGPREEMLPLAAALRRKGDRDEFRGARVREGRVELLRDEGSHLLGGLVGSDALCHLEAERTQLEAGEPVRVIRPLP